MKNILILFILLFSTIQVYSQKFAYVDTDYILNKIPEYKQAQEKLDGFSSKLESEIEEKFSEVDKLYRNYQKEQVLLTEEMKQKREELIIEKEKEAKNLQKIYFGPNGELFKKREELIKPIQDKVFDAIQRLASNNKYAVVFDSASDLIMLYSNPNLDKSDKVLELMGY